MRLRRALEACFSDRARTVVVPLVAIALTLGWVDTGRMVAARYPSVASLQANPESFVGSEFYVAFGRVARAVDDGFVIRSWGDELEVTGELAGALPGTVVSVAGTITPGHRLALSEGRIHDARRLKWLLGIVTLGVVGVMFWRELSDQRA